MLLIDDILRVLLRRKENHILEWAEFICSMCEMKMLSLSPRRCLERGTRVMATALLYMPAPAKARSREGWSFCEGSRSRGGVTPPLLRDATSGGILSFPFPFLGWGEVGGEIELRDLATNVGLSPHRFISQIMDWIIKRVHELFFWNMFDLWEKKSCSREHSGPFGRFHQAQKTITQCLFVSFNVISSIKYIY